MSLKTSGLTADNNGNLNANTVTIVTPPTLPNQLANKGYVDGISAGLDPKSSCNFASTSNYSVTYNNGTSGVGATLTATANGVFVIDSNTPTTARVLIKNQTNQLENGIYNITNPGSVSTPFILTRSTDFNNTNNVTSGAYSFVTSGTVNIGTGWVVIANDPITIGTTNIPFTQISSGANSLLKINNLSDLTNVPLARTNLGLGTAATKASSNFIQTIKTITFNTSGTYTPTVGMKQCYVMCIGGGGGGGGAEGGLLTGSASGGGASGQTVYSLLTAAQIGASQTVTIGIGGLRGNAGNNPGSAGGDTRLGSLCIAKGGNGGAGGAASGAASISAGGAPGSIVNAVGDIIFSGNYGGPGIALSPTLTLGGAGAPSSMGGGTTSGPNALGPITGRVGAGGAGSGANGTSKVGASGSNGFMSIIEYIGA